MSQEASENTLTTAGQQNQQANNECSNQENESPLKKNTLLQKLDKARKSIWANIFFSLLVPLVTLITLEWIARGTLAALDTKDGFFQSLLSRSTSFLLTYLLFLFIYVFISQLSGRHIIATIIVGLLGNIPAVITYYKLEMRGEPFYPWDFNQAGDFFSIQSSIEFAIPASIITTCIVFALLLALAYFIKIPKLENGKSNWFSRLYLSGTSLVLCLLLLFGVYLNFPITNLLKIQRDQWRQDRNYRMNGVVTGFLLNAQQMQIGKPENYNKEYIQQLLKDIDAHKSSSPYFEASSGDSSNGLFSETKDPDIIYIMAESFWNPMELEGVEFDQPLTPNLDMLKGESAQGYSYSPRFGGGTCDVEFEALTGFSVDHLPFDSKPFQQYVTKEMFSMPNYLKDKGYETMAIHGYGGAFWNRDKAYPRLGIDTFISSENFVKPELRRGFISDNAMVDRIIYEYEMRLEKKEPMFIHAVTMQNHSTYAANRYPADQLVKVTSAPKSLDEKTIGALEDYATSIKEMDEALGKMVEYLRGSSRPAVLVFWGDHLNPIGTGTKLYEKTNFIPDSNRNTPNLHKTPLMMWSNYSQQEIDLGTIGAYNISPVMMDTFGLEKPIMFEYLVQQLDAYRAKQNDVVINPDGSITEELNEEQQKAYDDSFVLQYDYMFGKQYADEVQAKKE